MFLFVVGMKLLALVIFVCVAHAYSAAVSKDEIDSIPQPDLLDALDRGYDDDVSINLMRPYIDP